MIEIRLALGKDLVLVRLQCSLFNLLLVEGEHIDALEAFLLPGLECGDLAPQREQRLILGAVFFQQRLIAGVAVQIINMVLLIKQLLAVVLAVDINQIGRELPQHRCRHRFHIHPAGALAVRCDLALDVQRVRLIAGKRQLVEQRCKRGRQPGEHRADKALVCARPHQVAADASAQHRADRVDHNGLACAGLAREHGQPILELDIRLLDDRDIFNMEQLQHGCVLPCLLQNIPRLLAETCSAVIIPHDGKHGIVAAQRTDHVRCTHRVDRHSGCLPQTGQGLDDHHVLRRVDLRNALAKNIAQPCGKAVCRAGRGCSILIFSVSAESDLIRRSSLMSRDTVACVVL